MGGCDWVAMMSLSCHVLSSMMCDSVLVVCVCVLDLMWEKMMAVPLLLDKPRGPGNLCLESGRVVTKSSSVNNALVGLALAEQATQATAAASTERTQAAESTRGGTSEATERAQATR